MRLKKGDRVLKFNQIGTIVSGRLTKATKLIKGDMFYVQWDDETEQRLASSGWIMKVDDGEIVK